MKKTSIILVLCFLTNLLIFPVLAQDQSMPMIQIDYETDATLSQTEAVEAQVSLTQSEQEASFAALIRLDDEFLDVVESLLPQKSLRIEGDDMQFDLYNGGSDGRYTMLIATVCSRLITQGPIDIPVRAQEPVEVYLNGEYWGIYTKQEAIADAIVRFEGLEDTATLNVTNVNKDVICGSESDIAAAITRMKSLDLSQEVDRQILNGLLDTESFLNWLAVNSYFGTGNLFGEIIYYQIDNGPWKCAMGDFSYALLYADANPFAALNDQRSYRFDTAILAKMMLEQPVYRDAFLTKLGVLYRTFSTSLMQSVVDAENEKIASTLLKHMIRWSDEFARALCDEHEYPVANAREAVLFQTYRVYRLREKTLVRRPWYLYDLVQSELNVSDEDMVHYFGGPKPELPEVSGDTWTDYKAVNLK